MVGIYTIDRQMCIVRSSVTSCGSGAGRRTALKTVCVTLRELLLFLNVLDSRGCYRRVVLHYNLRVKDTETNSKIDTT